MHPSIRCAPAYDYSIIQWNRLRIRIFRAYICTKQTESTDLWTVFLHNHGESMAEQQFCILRFDCSFQQLLLIFQLLPDRISTIWWHSFQLDIHSLVEFDLLEISIKSVCKAEICLNPARIRTLSDTVHWCYIWFGFTCCGIWYGNRWSNDSVFQHTNSTRWWTSCWWFSIYCCWWSLN